MFTIATAFVVAALAFINHCAFPYVNALQARLSGTVLCIHNRPSSLTNIILVAAPLSVPVAINTPFAYLIPVT